MLGQARTAETSNALTKSFRPSLKWNAAWNCAGTAGDALSAVITVPFTIRTLGVGTYGLWILVASLTGCFGIVDLGVRNALGRQLAFYRARGNVLGVNATLNTALALLLGACATAIVVLVVLQLLFFQLFDVPEEQTRLVRIALMLAGLNLALSFPLSAFDSTLWAAERFDHLNQIGIIVNLFKVALLFMCLTADNGLVLLPCLTLGGVVVAAFLKAVVTHRNYIGLSYGKRWVRRWACREIFGFGLWQFGGAFATQLLSRVPVMAIGAFISPGAVTPYSVAEKVLSCFTSFFTAFTGVLTPRSAAYAAREELARQQELFTQGARICWGLAVFAGVGVWFFGPALVTVWLGLEHQLVSVYLRILAFGMVVYYSQSVTMTILLGLARHQILMVLTILSSLLSSAGVICAARYGTGTAVCITVAVVWTLFGTAVLVHGCNVCRIPFAAYLRRAALPAFVASALVSFAWWTIGTHSPDSIATLFLHIGTFTTLFAGPFWWLCVRRQTVGKTFVASGSIC
jgi:O-antigen/teichoic acid export membrane protein